MVLYHGSSVAVRTPEIRPLVRALDFGRAFYLTSSEEQAMKWAKTATLRRGEGLPTVSVFGVDKEQFDGLKIVKFLEPTSEWLRYVSKNRNQGVDDSNADVVVGPVANDNTMPVLNLYFKGAYTEEEAIRRLLPQHLRDQFAFKTERSLASLKFVESREVP